ncbi:hypothetical protein QT711_11330 [Sporosarcina saromensis]|uniref:Uncharacterized protein n=1 Tax=Sporosarcina saromensis TaxID=359365 RepID=A0ABU4G9Y6_9BACL|nr:hypothetical protein [Sporosarcina saromensis]MDW0113780.1 hypothetical protein [Sporosarcina saromensis]
MKTLQTELVEKDLSRPRTGEVEQKSIRTRGSRKERLTSRDWAEIMGTNRPTYGRKKGGAYRQR